MKTKNFPLVDPSNLWLSCFNCRSDMYDFYYQKSDNESGNGKYYASCECCGMKTYFYFKKGSDSQHNTLEQNEAFRKAWDATNARYKAFDAYCTRMETIKAIEEQNKVKP